jgi:hypothetical protein
MKRLFLILALLASTFANAQSYASIPSGVIWPWTYVPGKLWAFGVVTTMNAADTRHAAIGTASFVGRPTGAQAFGATAKVGFFTGAVTFANAGTTIDICIQGVTAAAGPIARPDGTCKGALRTLTGGTDTITANTYNEFTLSTSGTSFNVTQGDLIAVVINMTARGGSDSVTILPAATAGVNSLPVTNSYIAAAWQTTTTLGAGQTPMVTFTSDTLTLGTLGGTWVMAQEGVALSWSSATNPKDRAQVFQVPFGAKIDALWTSMRILDGNSDFTISLYSDCETATPTALASVAVEAASLGAPGGEGPYIAVLPTEVTLAANVDYCVSVLATGSSVIRMGAITLGDAAHRSFYPGGATLRSVTRNDTAAFGSSSTTVHYPMGVRISQVASGGGGSIGGVF